ncbi:uncharacterized [Tachysurus ichikawai]
MNTLPRHIAFHPEMWLQEKDGVVAEGEEASSNYASHHMPRIVTGPQNPFAAAAALQPRPVDFLQPASHDLHGQLHSPSEPCLSSHRQDHNATEKEDSVDESHSLLIGKSHHPIWQQHGHKWVCLQDEPTYHRAQMQRKS